MHSPLIPCTDIIQKASPYSTRRGGSSSQSAGMDNIPAELVQAGEAMTDIRGVIEKFVSFSDTEKRKDFK